jgi:hypothetical protein
LVDIEPMLEAVDWPSLSHAYGPASDTPGHLRALLAEDAARVAAYAELNGSIWHQNTVYDATVAAVPILSAIARTAARPGYYALALLLVCAEAADQRATHRDATREAVAVELPALLAHFLATDDASYEPHWTLVAGTVAMLPEYPLDPDKLEAFLELSWGTDAAALLTIRQLVAPKPFPADVLTTPVVDLAFNSAHRTAGSPPLEPR